MKNIHVLPTDKPSRLHLWTDENGTRPALCELEYSHTRNTQNLYITSDEEIKEGDWFIYKNEIIHRDKGDVDSIWVDAIKNGKKIILTTDADLIKDGVQAIDDEFLEWFVKNPSCEKVKVEGHIYKGQDETEYKIIIPKEEPKQLNSEDFGLPKIRTKEFNDLASALFGGKPKQDFILVKEDCTCTDECMYYLSKQCKHLKEEPKQETLEEVKKK